MRHGQQSQHRHTSIITYDKLPRAINAVLRSAVVISRCGHNSRAVAARVSSPPPAAVAVVVDGVADAPVAVASVVTGVPADGCCHGGNDEASASVPAGGIHVLMTNIKLGLLRSPPLDN
jgi:hypothetical protein